jgi:hypothetical protein
MAGSAVRMTSSTTGPSASIVMTTDAPETALGRAPCGLGAEPLGGGGRPVPDANPEPGLHEAPGDRRAHDARAEDGDVHRRTLSLAARCSR